LEIFSVNRTNTKATLKIINTCKEAGLPEPEIKEKDGGIEIIIQSGNYEGNYESNHVGMFRIDFGKISERIRKEFGNETALSFEIIAKNPSYTSQQIALEIGKSARTIEKYISSLKKAGYIERKGPKLGGYWEVILN
jgi:ATP-dependent DNA helicase RecG